MLFQYPVPISAKKCIKQILQKNSFDENNCYLNFITSDLPQTYTERERKRRASLSLSLFFLFLFLFLYYTATAFVFRSPICWRHIA